MPVSIGYSASPQRAALASISAQTAGFLHAVRNWTADVAHRWVERHEALAALESIDDHTLKDIGVRRSAIESELGRDRE